MLNIFHGLSMAVLLMSFTACSKAQKPAEQIKNDLKNKKVLIVYLSRTNNTKALATIIHAEVGGTLMPLELVKPYPANYQAIVAQVADENASGFLPPLKTKIDSMEKYDVIFLGFPTWGMQLPPPMKSFLKANNLSGKTVIPFNSNAGYGIGSTMETLKSLCPNSKVLEGFTTKGGIERDGVLFVMEGQREVQVKKEIADWLQKLAY